jgi:parallel beta-helix repeat protein
MFLLLALQLLAPAPARAETTSCIGITSLPADLVAPGHYCLFKDFDVPLVDRAFLINSPGVVLDCNGHRVRNSNAEANANGVTSWAELQDVIVRNCVFDNFYVGIFLTSASDGGSHGNLVEGNTVAHSTWAGIYVGGSNNRIERNRVVQSTSAFNGSALGIAVFNFNGTAAGNAIRDNYIGDWKPAPPAGANNPQPIVFDSTRNTEVTGNTISGVYAYTGTGVYAITGYNASGSTVSRNTLLTPPTLAAPFDGEHYVGIYVPGTPETEATNVCRDNVIGHYGNAAYGCVQADNTSF